MKIFPDQIFFFILIAVNNYSFLSLSE